MESSNKENMFLNDGLSVGQDMWFYRVISFSFRQCLPPALPPRRNQGAPEPSSDDELTEEVLVRSHVDCTGMTPDQSQVACVAMNSIAVSGTCRAGACLLTTHLEAVFGFGFASQVAAAGVASRMSNQFEDYKEGWTDIVSYDPYPTDFESSTFL